MLIGKHDVGDDVGIPIALALLLDPGLREDVMDVAAGGFAQPGVVQLDETVSLQIARPP